MQIMFKVTGEIIVKDSYPGSVFGGYCGENVNTSTLGRERNAIRRTLCPGWPGCGKDSEVAGSCSRCPSDFWRGTSPRAEGTEACMQELGIGKGPEPTWMSSPL